MYAEHFRLRHEPFSIAPDPRFLFMSAQHREALAHLLYGVGGGGGFVLLTGEIGAGKTTVCRCFLEQIPAQCRVAYIFNPKLTVPELLQTICEEFRVELPRDSGPGVKGHVDALNRFLLAAHARGENAVLIIDEAQSLSPEVLEQLRLLTNLETAERKLLQIVLIGQPELRAMLGQPGLEQLAQRVIARYHLGALSADETAQYVKHRLVVAGGTKLPFEREAMARLHALSGGVPRRINLLADRALLGAYSQGRRKVDRATLEGAAREVFGRRVAGAGAWRSAPAWGWALAGGIVAGVGTTALGAWWLGAGGAGKAGAARVAAVASAPGAAPVAASGVASGAAATTAAKPAAGSASGPAAAADAGEPGGLAALLTAAPPREDEALRALAALWQVELPAGDPCDVAAAAGLACHRGRDGFAALQVLDRPAVLSLRGAQGEAVPVLLVALDPREATLRAGTQTQRVARAELAASWRGEFTTWWRPPPAWRAGADTTPEPVRAWARERLAAAGLADDRLALRERVRTFQVASGLEPDGVPGPLTLMLLARHGSDDREPRLARLARDSAAGGR
jgi:general secretion pathway protein A